MDLSIRKPPPTPIFSQSSYMMRDAPTYAYIPPTAFIPTPSQPSVSHLGLFQQLQCDAAQHPVTFPIKQEYHHAPVLTPTVVLPQIMHSPSDSSEHSMDMETDSSCKSATHFPVKRPFKSISATRPTPLTFASVLDPDLEVEFEKYREKVLSSMSHQQSSECNRNMRRNVNTNPEKCLDPEYLERRRKNNEAAKRSREARKAKEDELAIRVAFLENENLKMKFQLAAIEREKKLIMMRRCPNSV